MTKLLYKSVVYHGAIVAELKNKSNLPAVAVIGCGNMGGAILRGLVHAAYSGSGRLSGCDSDADKLSRLEREGIKTDLNPAAAAKNADIIIIAVKPNLVEGVVKLLASTFSKKSRPILVSIAAGITTKRLARAWGSADGVARVMPNLPVTVGAGVFGLYTDSPRAAEVVKQLFGSLGHTLVLGNESEIDAVTALSASGPAFFAHALDGIITGGVKVGLSRDKAELLAVQTMLGTAKLLAATGDHPAVLQAKVSSPAGTTIQGIHELEAAGVRSAFISAIEAATARARELSEEDE